MRADSGSCHKKAAFGRSRQLYKFYKVVVADLRREAQSIKPAFPACNVY